MVIRNHTFTKIVVDTYEPVLAELPPLYTRAYVLVPFVCAADGTSDVYPDMFVKLKYIAIGA